MAGNVVTGEMVEELSSLIVLGAGEVPQQDHHGGELGHRGDGGGVHPL